MRVHAPEKNCCRSRQPDSGRFAPRGFANRAEDKETVGEHKPLPLDFDMTRLPLYPPVQAKFSGGSAGDGRENKDAASLEGTGEKAPAAGQVQPEADRQEPNRTGMPDRLKAGIEALSGFYMSDVVVHYNSPKPAMLNALAYTQGNQIFMGPGQERHLPHEAWHVAQQKQGRVRATRQMKGVRVDEDVGLEREADLMGGRALQMQQKGTEMQDETPCYLTRAPCEGTVVSRNVLQMTRTLISRIDKPPWYWVNDLNFRWRNNPVPLHNCHNKTPPLNMLYGGWTVIDSSGTTDKSKTYGPFKPKSGEKKSGHVEKLLFNEMRPSLIQEMENDTKYNDDALAVIEINQWYTPCSGQSGCTTFLNDEIRDLNNMYSEVSAAGRFQAKRLYESGLSEQHPLNPKLKETEKKVLSDDEMDVEGGEIVHKNVGNAY